MSVNPDKLKLAIPKGSLQERTLDLFEKAGYNVYVSSRGLRPTCDDSDLDLYLIRAQEVAQYISSGFIDCGITGLDWAQGHTNGLVDMAELPFSRASNRPTKWVLVVPEQSPVQTVYDLQGKRIATEGIEITKKYLREKGVECDVEFSWGATEVKVPDLVDAIVDVTETGSSIRANNLRIVDTLLTSFPHFYSSKQAHASEWKKAKMERLVMMLQGAMFARDKVGLKLNLPKDQLDAVVDMLPSLRRPTVSPLLGEEDQWVAIETIIDESVARKIIPDLKGCGAEGIIEYPLNKIVL